MTNTDMKNRERRNKHEYNEKFGKDGCKVARNQSYKKSRTTDMFQYFFTKMWREKGHPASGIDRPTKKRRR